MRGAWIEIKIRYPWTELTESLPVRGAWIEMLCMGGWKKLFASLPVRGAWIEIRCRLHRFGVRTVAPRAGSVD